MQTKRPVTLAKPISCHFQAETKKRLDSAAQRLRVPLAEIIRQAVEHQLAVWERGSRSKRKGKAMTSMLTPYECLAAEATLAFLRCTADSLDSAKHFAATAGRPETYSELQAASAALERAADRLTRVANSVIPLVRQTCSTGGTVVEGADTKNSCSVVDSKPRRN